MRRLLHPGNLIVAAFFGVWITLGMLGLHWYAFIGTCIVLLVLIGGGVAWPDRSET